MNKEFKIIAETAFSHEGDFEYLKAQVTAAKTGNADYVKFQILVDENEYTVAEHPAIPLIKKWKISNENWIKILEFAKSLNLKTIALPLEHSATRFCKENESLIDVYEIHSVCFHDFQIIDLLKNSEKSVILGIGGRTESEIINLIKKLNLPKEKIISMLGFQSFPTDKNFLNLGKTASLRESGNSEIGFADHTDFSDNSFHELNKYAFLLGATYFEKHIVLEKGQKRTDYESAICSDDFLEMRKQINSLISVLGTENLSDLNEKENNYRNREKTLVAKTNINKNSPIQKNDLCFKISEEKNDIYPLEISKIIEKTALENIQKGQPILTKHFQE